MISAIDFGIAPNGEKVQLFTIKNKNGISTKITNYGGILTSLKLPIGAEEREVVLGFDSLDEYTDKHYLENNPFFGAIVGRFANRINKGKVIANGQTIQLSCNFGKHHLHGGFSGFDKKVWHAEIMGESALKLSCTSPDGEEGFPGNVTVDVIYQLTDENELCISYHAVSDKSTPINLTQHSYFNLSANTENILGHELWISADSILETDDSLIPTGKLAKVDNTPFDFRNKKKIARDIDVVENYDHCFALGKATKEPKKIAVLSEPNSNVIMEVLTTFPGLQVYTGKHLSIGKQRQFGSFAGIAIEAQGYLDAPNLPQFGHGWLHPGEIYKHQTIYRFLF